MAKIPFAFCLITFTILSPGASTVDIHDFLRWPKKSITPTSDPRTSRSTHEGHGCPRDRFHHYFIIMLVAFVRGIRGSLVGAFSQASISTVLAPCTFLCTERAKYSAHNVDVRFLFTAKLRGDAQQIRMKIETCEMTEAVNGSISFNTCTRLGGFCQHCTVVNNTAVWPGDASAAVAYNFVATHFEHTHDSVRHAKKCTEKLSGF